MILHLKPPLCILFLVLFLIKCTVIQSFHKSSLFTQSKITLLHLNQYDIIPFDEYSKYDVVELLSEDTDSYIPAKLPLAKTNEVMELDTDLQDAYELVYQDIEEVSFINSIKKLIKSMTSFAIIFGGISAYTYFLFPGSFHAVSSVALSPEALEYVMYTEPEYSESGGVVFDDREYPQAKLSVTVLPYIIPTTEIIEAFYSGLVEDI